MNFYNLPTNFEMFSETQVNSLTFLRAARDVLAEHLEMELNTSKAAEWINDLVNWEGPWSAFNHMKARIMDDNPRYITRKYEELELLRRIVFRIARLEREGCHVPKEQFDRELLNA